MTFTADPVKMAAVAEATDIADTAIRLMICDELLAKIPGLEETEALAAADLRDAVEALRLPEKALRELESELARAEGETRSWDAQARSDDISARVAAKAWFTEWNAELNTLTAKREQMERDLHPLRVARDEARNRLRNAQDDIRLTAFNASSPDYAYLGFGPKTEAFRGQWGFFGGFVKVLLKGDKGFLWDEATDFMDYLCVKSGYRTANRDLPDAAKIRAEALDEIYANANPPQAAPSGAEVVANVHAQQDATMRARQQQAALDNTVVEDHRQPDPAKLYQRLSSIRTT